MNEHFPTAKLRFIERDIPVDKEYVKTVRVLQQYWEPIGHTEEGFWKDVELVQK